MTYARTNTPRITDEEILEWITQGLLILRNGKEVWKWHGRRNRYEQLRVSTYDEDGRMRVNLRHGRKGTDQERQRTIYLNKLVWMFMRREIVPAGYVINHINEDCTDDSYSNLELQTEEESDRQGRTLQGHISAKLIEEYGEF